MVKIEINVKKTFVEITDCGWAYTTHSKAKEYGLKNYHYWKRLPGPVNGEVYELVKPVFVNNEKGHPGSGELSLILKDKNGIEYLIGIKGCKFINKNNDSYREAKRCWKYKRY